jgi:hypothetical protein
VLAEAELAVADLRADWSKPNAVATKFKRDSERAPPAPLHWLARPALAHLTVHPWIAGPTYYHLGA